MIKQKRILEVDLLRGFALFLMIIFHLFFDLSYFYGIKFDFLESGLNTIIQLFGAGIFIFLVGVSSFLFFSNDKDLKTQNSKYLKDGIYIFSLGMLITIVTFLFDSNVYIRFGILHFMGCAKLIIPYYRVLTPKIKTFLIFLILLFGFVFERIYLKTNFLVFLGIKGIHFASLDYYPLFPWLSLVFLGELVASYVYRKRNSIFTIREGTLGKVLVFASKKSLLIYLIHQPILLGILYIIFNL